MIAEGIYGLTRSKELVTALNRHGICASYDTVRRIDVDLAERIISIAGDNRVPLPPVLEATSPLNGAMDNFDRNESTLAGTLFLYFFKMFQSIQKSHPREVKSRRDYLFLKIGTQSGYNQRSSVRNLSGWDQ